MNQVRVAVIGAGIWGGAHLRAYAQHASAELVAVCDIDEARAKAAAAAWAVPNVYTSLDDMLAAETLDAVSVATPDAAHTDVVVACVAAGLHVLCEKPLATTVADGQAMIAAADAAGAMLMVGWHNRWNPPFVEAHRSIREGELGEVRYVYYRLSDTVYVPTQMLPWAGESSVMHFLGSHALDTTCWLLGRRPVRLSCRRQAGVLKAMGVNVADLYVTTLEFDDGALAVIENSWILPQSSPALIDHRVEILGSDGAIYLNPQHAGSIAKYTARTPAGFPDASLPDMFVTPEVHGRQVGFAVESIYHFVECVRDGRPPLANAEDGLFNTRLILAAEQSADQGGAAVALT
ncbi:MAG: Gfo/Idh/MocA family protein [Planctomycetota bacterium]|jgi:predicted dehydrogenase